MPGGPTTPVSGVDGLGAEPRHVLNAGASAHQGRRRGSSTLPTSFGEPVAVFSVQSHLAVFPGVADQDREERRPAMA